MLLLGALRGIGWEGDAQTPYPRADPSDSDRLPGDTWGTAQIPVGVRLEFVGDAQGLEIDYACSTADVGYRAEGAGTTFSAWRGDVEIAAATASVEDDEGTAVHAGAARGEIASAEQIAASRAEVIAIAIGTNCWTRIPHGRAYFREGLLALLSIVRQGHPQTPIVVASPVLRPDAEATVNRLGATLADLREEVEAVVTGLARGGAEDLHLVRGFPLLTADQLPDGIHPGDDGHAILPSAIGDVVSRVSTR